MNLNDILLLTGDEIITRLKNRDPEILASVKLTYQIHDQGNSCLPHSVFLGLPNNQKNRIIALPAYVGSELNMAGIKWIASFPKNFDLFVSRSNRPTTIADGKRSRYSLLALFVKRAALMLRA
ncbi:hypothetical protein [Microseira wollei]|uniref:Alanine dehydrogenase n=1 Tax=Microseira wollei NIES-4236 TaxID=2530354 RepID=A0AAV3XG53_9CYAN|nr:hypothetical protein [Microseira wollei]GET41238.1 alanine dehydrogenase [Microseira wollei NIES-4236]